MGEPQHYPGECAPPPYGSGRSLAQPFAGAPQAPRLDDQPPTLMIHSIRLQRAAELLAQKTGSVAEIAYFVVSTARRMLP